MDATSAPPRARAHQRRVRGGDALAVLASPVIALLMAALDSCVVAVLALVGGLLLTRDPYLALLALSYGPFSAAPILQPTIVATAGWSVAWVLTRGDTRARISGPIAGAVVSLAALWLGAQPLLGSVAAAWRYGPTLAPASLTAPLALASGAVAGYAPTWWRARAPQTSSDPFARVAGDVAVFAGVLAVLLEGTVVLLSLIGG